MKSLERIEKLSDFHLVGNECFSINGKDTDMTILEYWRWHYSEIFDLQDTIAEYIVAKALGLTQAHNVGQWTLFDILYRNMRIEIKETSYYHAWQSDDERKSQQRTFSITKAYTEYKDEKSEYKRQNDIYVFCLNTGETRKDSNPLVLEHWEFYIVPTHVIDKECGERKSISLKKVRKLSTAVGYSNIKKTIDCIIDTMEK